MLFGGLGTCVFWGAPETGDNRDFFDFAGPRVPQGPRGGVPTDCVVSWGTVGGIRVFVCPQGPPQAGFGVAKDRCARRRAHLVGQIWLENSEILPSLLLPGPGCPVDPTVGSHSDCVVSWDTLEGVQALFRLLGRNRLLGPRKMAPGTAGSFCR